MVELAELFIAWEQRVVVSVAIALLAMALGLLIRRARVRLSERGHPVIVDFLASVLLVGVLIATTLLLAELWEQTEALLDQLGFLQLEARASQVVMTIVVIVGVQVLGGIATRLLDDLTTQSDTLSQHQREVALRTTQLVLWITGLIVVLGIWAIDLTGLLVGAGFIGIVLGLASQKTLGSLLAGFMLMFSRPFHVGDWIVVGDYEGIVSDITMMSTRLRSRNGEYVVVPNDRITSETVINRTRQGALRIEVDIGVDYAADVAAARTTAQDVVTELVADPGPIQGHPAPDVLVRQLGDSAVLLIVRAWIRPPEPGLANEARQQMVVAIKGAFDQAGIKIPYPQREITGREETGGLRIVDTGAVIDEQADEQ